MFPLARQSSATPTPSPPLPPDSGFGRTRSPGGPGLRFGREVAPGHDHTAAAAPSPARGCACAGTCPAGRRGAGGPPTPRRRRSRGWLVTEAGGPDRAQESWPRRPPRPLCWEPPPALPPCVCSLLGHPGRAQSGLLPSRGLPRHTPPPQGILYNFLNIRAPRPDRSLLFSLNLHPMSGGCLGGVKGAPTPGSRSLVNFPPFASPVGSSASPALRQHSRDTWSAYTQACPACGLVPWEPPDAHGHARPSWCPQPQLYVTPCTQKCTHRPTGTLRLTGRHLHLGGWEANLPALPHPGAWARPAEELMGQQRGGGAGHRVRGCLCGPWEGVCCGRV